MNLVHVSVTLKLESNKELLVLLDAAAAPDHCEQKEEGVFIVGSAAWDTIMDSLPVEPRLEIECMPK